MEAALRKAAYFGNPFIGLFLSTNNSHTLLPVDSPESIVRRVEDSLGTEPIPCAVHLSNINGIYVAMNSNGILLPAGASEDTASMLKEKTGLNVAISPTPFNANGNNIAANDKGGVINPDIPASARKVAEDCLGVELTPAKIADFKTVGSCCVATNKGFIAHYSATDAEMGQLSSIFGVSGLKGTANTGTGFVSICLLANDKGFIAGESTTAYELGRIEEALDLIGG